MKLTNSMIIKHFKKVQKNALKHLKYLPISVKIIFDNPDPEDSIFNIEINKDFSEQAIAMMEQIPQGEDEPKYVINLNPDMIENEQQLLEVVAHEICHFIDFKNCRVPNHDLHFLHMWSLLTDFKLDLEEAMLQYVYDYESEEFDGMIPYKEIMRGIKK